MDASSVQVHDARPINRCARAIGFNSVPANLFCADDVYEES